MWLSIWISSQRSFYVKVFSLCLLCSATQREHHAEWDGAKQSNTKSIHVEKGCETRGIQALGDENLPGAAASLRFRVWISSRSTLKNTGLNHFPPVCNGTNRCLLSWKEAAATGKLILLACKQCRSQWGCSNVVSLIRSGEEEQRAAPKAFLYSRLA